MASRTTLHSSSSASLGVNSKSQHTTIPHLAAAKVNSIGTQGHQSSSFSTNQNSTPPIQKPFMGGTGVVSSIGAMGHLSGGGPQASITSVAHVSASGGEIGPPPEPAHMYSGGPKPT